MIKALEFKFININLKLKVMKTINMEEISNNFDMRERRKIRIFRICQIIRLGKGVFTPNFESEFSKLGF